MPLGYLLGVRHEPTHPNRKNGSLVVWFVLLGHVMRGRKSGRVAGSLNLLIPLQVLTVLTVPDALNLGYTRLRPFPDGSIPLVYLTMYFTRCKMKYFLQTIYPENLLLFHHILILISPLNMPNPARSTLVHLTRKT